MVATVTQSYGESGGAQERPSITPFSKTNVGETPPKVAWNDMDFIIQLNQTFANSSSE